MTIADIVTSKVFWVATVHWCAAAYLFAAPRFKTKRSPRSGILIAESLVELAVFLLIFLVPLWALNIIPLNKEKVEPYISGVVLAAVLAVIGRIWIRRKAQGIEGRP